VDRPDTSFLGSFITQEYPATRHDNQQPWIARVTANNSARPSADNRSPRGASPRPVHDRGRVTWPLTPPEHTNTKSPPRRLTNSTSSRCPLSTWKGCVTTTKPKSSLDDVALCHLRRHGGGQDPSTGRRRGAQRRLRDGFPGLFLRFSARAQPASGVGCAHGWDLAEESELGARCG